MPRRPLTFRAPRRPLVLKAGGEGTRGGRVLGHTKSGKPVYESGSIRNYARGFSAADHADAHGLHADAAATLKRNLRARGGTPGVNNDTRFSSQLAMHNALAKKHGEAAAGERREDARRGGTQATNAATYRCSSPDCSGAMAAHRAEDHGGKVVAHTHSGRPIYARGSQGRYVIGQPWPPPNPVVAKAGDEGARGGTPIPPLTPEEHARAVKLNRAGSGTDSWLGRK